MTDPRRHIPRTDAVLADPRFVAAIERLGPHLVKVAVLAAQGRARAGDLAPSDVPAAALAALPVSATTMHPILNATGVVLHTNIGRAPLSAAAVAAMSVAAGYVDVEFDRAAGARARRGRGTLAALAARVPSAGAVHVVNNGAAALVLATTVLAADREVIISRGELVEIGDGFRLPDLIESTGAQIREVGTTNRVKVADYAAAITSNTGCILKIHPSNFRIEGYTSAVPIVELATLGPPVVADIGSGLLVADPLLPDEPDVTSTLAAGAELVTCSADKLLGGPQAGLILGTAEAVERLRRHPLARALRVDKITLAALEATLHGPSTPTTQYLHADVAWLRARCEQIAARLSEHAIDVALVPCVGAVGGGSAPQLSLPGWALSLPVAYAEPLRCGDPSVLGRVEHRRCLLDLRCIPPAADAVIIDAVTVAAMRAACT